MVRLRRIAAIERPLMYYGKDNTAERHLRFMLLVKSNVGGFFFYFEAFLIVPRHLGLKILMAEWLRWIKERSGSIEAEMYLLIKGLTKILVSLSHTSLCMRIYAMQKDLCLCRSKRILEGVTLDLNNMIYLFVCER